MTRPTGLVSRLRCGGPVGTPGWVAGVKTGGSAVDLFPLASLAIIAGLVSFSAPCSLPLVPGFVGYLSGLSGLPGRGRTRVAVAAALFVLGFAVVFTAMGATASAVGAALLRSRPVLDVVAGAVVITMGLLTVGILRIPLLTRLWRPDLRRVGRGPLGAVSLGSAFALGWTPCVGPVLASILATASGTGTVARGAVLLFAYSLGLGVPFVALAHWIDRGGRTPRWLRRHSRRIEVAGGVLLVAMGIALVTGQWAEMMNATLSSYARLGWPPI